MRLSPRIRSALSVPVLALALTGATGGAAALMAATPAFAVASDVVVDYQMMGNYCGPPSHPGPCSESVTIVANPRNVAVRAENDCSGGGHYVGGTKYSVGQTSSTGPCANGFYSVLAGFQFTLNRNSYTCYFNPGSWNGRCP